MERARGERQEKPRFSQAVKPVFPFFGKDIKNLVGITALQILLLAVFLLGIITYMLAPTILYFHTELKVGDTATWTLKAPTDLEIEDTRTAEEGGSSALHPLYYKIKRGEIILKKGDRITEDHLPILEKIARYQRKNSVTQMLSGLFLIVLIIIYIFYLDLKRYKPAIARDPIKLSLLGIIISTTILISKLSYFLLGAFADRFYNIDISTIMFAIPAAIGAMLITILFDIHIGLISSTIIALLMGLLIPEERFFVIYTFIGGIVASLSVLHCKKRAELLRAGLFIGLANLLMAVAIDLYETKLFTPTGPFDMVFAVSGGLIVSLVVSGLLPLFESLFEATTDFKLVELLDMNQPILKDLLLTAPGTYYHSIMISSLAESAAEAISANPLLTRICAYYHDIGKSKKPEYFIENQIGPVNRHDKLSPHMSSLILISHVKDGVELAREHR
ncbi:MAG: HDIG domain-containing metalloprotein, partial [Nitrospirota bacterium]